MTELGYLWKKYSEIILHYTVSYPQEVGIVGRSTYICLEHSYIIIILTMPTFL